MEIRAISIIQPWATFIILGEKEYETRAWSNGFKGPVIIHASKKKTTELAFTCQTNPIVAELFKKHNLDFETLPRGGFIGEAEIVECIPTSQFNPSEKERAVGDFRPGRFAFKLTNPKPFPIIECAGCLGLYRLPGHPRAHG